MSFLLVNPKSNVVVENKTSYTLCGSVLVYKDGRKVFLLRSKKGVSRRGKSKFGQGSPPQLPLPLEITPRLRKVIRFFTESAVSAVGITYGDLFGIFGGICSVTNATLRPIATSVLLHSVTIFPNASTSATQTSEISWTGANADQTPDFSYNESLPANVVETHPVRAVPPKASLMADWFNNTVTASDIAFVLTLGSGTVLDVDVECTLPNNFSPVSLTIASGVLGTYYYLRLNHNGAKTITPVNLPTTT